MTRAPDDHSAEALNSPPSQTETRGLRALWPLLAIRREFKPLARSADATDAAMVNMSGQWERTERAVATSQPRPIVVRTCRVCGASIEGTIDRTADWFTDHRRSAHPELPDLVPMPRRKSGFGPA